MKPFEEMTPEEKREYIKSRSAELGTKYIEASKTGDDLATITAEIKTLEGLIGDDKDLFGEYEAIYNSKIVDGVEKDTTISDAAKKQIKAEITGRTAINALQAGVGIFQAVDASRKKKGLSAPKLPQRLRKNAGLSTQLNSARVRQSQGDPEIDALFRDQVADQRAINDARAKTTGNTGRYVANAQANALRESDLFRAYASDRSSEKSRRRAETNQLIGQDIREDRAIQEDAFRRFREEDRDYEQSVSNLQRQTNSGVSNIVQGLSNSAGDLSYLFRGRDQEEDVVTNPMVNNSAAAGKLFSKRFRDSLEGANDYILNLGKDMGIDRDEVDNNLVSRVMMG